jgi:hypothetical protein
MAHYPDPIEAVLKNGNARRRAETSKSGRQHLPVCAPAGCGKSPPVTEILKALRSTHRNRAGRWTSTA